MSSITLATGLILASLLANQESDEGDRLLAEARRHDAAGRGADAEAAADAVLKLNAKLVEAYYWRGRARFRQNKVQAAAQDFDVYYRERPGLASRQWERGIACYYAGRYRDGARQFALYQTYHDNDVENSVWRFMCMARTDGVEKARAAMLPIRDDPRTPMMEIYRLFRGEQKPADVLAAVDRDSPEPKVRQGRLFYARLYLGLYYEATGQADLARKYITLAATEHRDDQRINRYMWAVADVHHRRLLAK